MNNVDQLESEAIHVILEAEAQFEKPCLLFSGGKDSIVLVHLMKRAFWPGRIPFPLVHIDTGHNFPETIAFRDSLVKKLDLELIIGNVQETIDQGRAIEEEGSIPSRNRIQSITLLDTIKKYQFDCCFGGARRDEEKARAKERFFSHRNSFGQWDPKNQRPEPWTIFNGRKKKGEHFRIFPLSNWTELDIWEYVLQEKIELPKLYYAHEREVFSRQGALYYKADFMKLDPGEFVEKRNVRFRTIGDISCTSAIESNACNEVEVIKEILKSRIAERGFRMDDKFSESSMEDRKREGYF